MVTAKIQPPNVRTESARRLTLVRLLCAAPEPVVAITAPAGYGKTTVLAQWAERDADPEVLCACLAASLARVTAVDLPV